MNDNLGKYLIPTSFIDCNTPAIKQKSAELISGKENEIEKAKSLFSFVRDSIRYNLYVPRSRREHFKASRTLERGQGYCVQKAVLLAALARAAGIPAGLGFARIVNHQMPEALRRYLGSNIMPFHGYTELYLNGSWVKATPAFNLEMCLKNGIIPVEFDGRHDAMFPPCTQDGKRYIEYLDDLGHSADLPIAKVWAVLVAAYGKRSLRRPPKPST